MSTLVPKDHAEAIALFRSEIVGALTRRELERGDLAQALSELSQQRFRPPLAKSTKVYSVATLERWFYAYKSGGLEALRPSPRSDRGRCRDLTAEQRKLLAAIREEHPSASVPVILRTLVAEGRLDKDAISASSVRRFYQEQSLDRVSLRSGHATRGKVRLRWQAERPGALWHADVCHGAAIVCDGKSQPVRIHGILDDASRYILALSAHHTEREVDMLGLMVKAVRKHGPPDGLYLDNGSTYRGQTLSLACARMGTALIHAKPYDAPARGKMERFWRTLREGCLDFIGSVGSLHDLNVRLWAFVDQHYHRAPHGGLLGKTPADVYEENPRPIDAFDEAMLRKALTIQARRRVRRDSTLPMDGTDWETDLHFLAGKLVTVRGEADGRAPRARSMAARSDRSCNAKFSKEIDDNKLWLPESKRSLVDELVACVHERKHATITGDPGVGKTCVLRALRHALGTEQAFRLTYCHNVTLGRRDFYRHVCHALGIPYGCTAGDVFLSVSKHIEDLARERTIPVLLVDEAHLLHQDTLDHLHILLNYAWDSKALLSLILIGLPDLNERLAMRRNRSLHSRITYRLAIEPLSPDDTADYIRARLTAVGVTKELFTSDAIAVLHEAVSGSLRDIDRIAHNALRSSARRKRKLVERDVVQAVLQADSSLGLP